MPNRASDPAALVGLFAGNVICMCAFADALCDSGAVEKAALTAELEKKLSLWRVDAPDVRLLVPLQVLVDHLRRASGGLPELAIH